MIFDARAARRCGETGHSRQNVGKIEIGASRKIVTRTVHWEGYDAEGGLNNSEPAPKWLMLLVLHLSTFGLGWPGWRVFKR